MATFDISSVFIPRQVHIHGTRIAWPWGGGRWKRPQPNVLDRFRRLSSAPDEDVRLFVAQYGPAFFCSHGLPASHSSVPFGAQFGLEGCFPSALDGSHDWHAEPLESYRRFALGAGAIVEAAAALNAGHLPSEDVFLRFTFARRPLAIDTILFPRYALRPPPASRRNALLLDSARCRVAEEVNLWLEVTQNHPRIEWDHQTTRWRYAIRHSPLGILGPIAMALHSSVPESQGWLICSICGDTFEPRWTPRRGIHRYCDDCRGTPEHSAFLKRHQRARHRTEKS